VAKIVRTDRELELPGVDAALRAAGHDLVLLPDGIAEEELVNATKEADLILMCYTPITRRVIEAAHRLKGIVKYGVGIDAIDIAAARERGIPVVNVPEYAEQTVAEGAFALLMALAKNLKKLEKAMSTEGWVWPERRWLASDVVGKTVGVLGLGRIGTSFARMATAFRMRVVSYDPYVAEATHRDLRAMLAECDFVSIHCVLNSETRHLIGERELRAMKPSAYLINVSRGAIVDELALLKTLQKGGIAGAALDVYSHEPLAKQGHPLSALYAMDNVILSPHLTFYTHEAMARLEADTLERCREVLDGRPVTVRSRDPRLRSQARGVRFDG
jgi:D-3-phosphoglycerate dehydrogenase / 2-oxoglutarate reductase